jgi:G3E family GTPase
VNGPIPITVIAGRPGAGKTDVVDRLIPSLPVGSVLLCDGFTEHRHPGVEVVPIEAEVLHATDGCPCCGVRTDLVEAIDDLLIRRVRPPHVVIEAVAGSDLAMIAQTFLRTSRLRASARVAGLVAVVDGHAAGTALPAHPTAALEGLDLDAVAMADLVVVNRLDRLLPVKEQQAAWTLWSMCGARQVQVDHRRTGPDPLPQRILGLAGFDLERQSSALRTRPEDQVIDRAERPLRRVTLTVDGLLDRQRLDDWIGHVQNAGGKHLLRWRARFALADERRVWLGQGVRTSVEVDDGGRVTARPGSIVELIGRLPPADELGTGLLAACVA